MRKLVLIVMVATSVFAWDCTLKNKSTNGKSPEMFCRNISVIMTADNSDITRIKMGYGYSQADEVTKQQWANILMEQTEQCYSTCLASLGKRI